MGTPTYDFAPEYPRERWARRGILGHDRVPGCHRPLIAKSENSVAGLSNSTYLGTSPDGAAATPPAPTPCSNVTGNCGALLLGSREPDSRRAGEQESDVG